MTGGRLGCAASGQVARMTTVARSFRLIREWDGSKHRAFEELCYQLRDPVPNGSTVVKTGDPDGGYEWYFTLLRWNGMGLAGKIRF